jgi:hypothetical protein
MNELLYLDERRLDDYLLQALGSIEKIAKTKKLEVESSIAGPKAKIGQHFWLSHLHL